MRKCPYMSLIKTNVVDWAMSKFKENTTYNIYLYHMSLNCNKTSLNVAISANGSVSGYTEATAMLSNQPVWV